MIRRLLLLLVIGCFCVRAEVIRFDTIDQSVVRERIENVPETNKRRYETIRRLFTESGCGGDNLIDQNTKGVKYPNVVCSLPGTLASTIVACAHYDYVDRGRGLIDNWTGASLLPTLFASLVKTPRRHRFEFISFTGEEQGLLGSQYFVKHLEREERATIHAVINLDSLGLGPTNVELERGNPALPNALGTVAKFFKIPLNPVNVHRVGRSDSDSFQDAHIPAVGIHSVTTPTLHILHSPDDNIKALKFSDYYDSYRLIAAYLAYLDTALDKDKE
jgi:Zn-dependent M28 family amino/carboxypeptidase